MTRAFTRIWYATLGLFALAAFGARAGIARTRYFDPDEFQHLHGAFSIAQGLVPYRDYFEHHTPWFPYALSVGPRYFGDSVEIIATGRSAMALLSAVIVVLTYTLGRRLFDRETGLLGAALLSADLVFYEKIVEIRPDVPALVLWLAALTALAPPAGERPSMRRLFAAGLALGGAVMFTQKLLFGLAGVGGALLLRALWIDRAARPSERWQAPLVVGTGSALPGLATLIAFALAGAGWSFIENNFLMNAAWQASIPAGAVVVEIAHRSPLVFALGLGGWLLAFAARGSEASLGRTMAAGATASLVAGIWVIPVPHRQYFLPLIPLWCLYAAHFALGLSRGGVTAIAGEGTGRGDRRRRLSSGAVLSLVVLLFALLQPASLRFLGAAKPLHSALGLALAATLPALLLPRPWQRSLALAVAFVLAWVATPLGELGAAYSLGAGALALFATGASLRQQAVAHLFVWVAAVPAVAMLRGLDGPSNAATLSAIELVHANSSPETEILSGWGLTTPFRPHAYRYFFLHSEMRTMLDEREKGEAIVEVLEERRPPLVAYDDALRALAPEVRETIEARYRPSRVSPYWVRRDTSEIGPGLRR